MRRPPAARGSKSIKAFYMVQYEASPPRFKVMVNSRALVNKSFAYYLENRLREDFGLEGVPLIIDFEGKEERLLLTDPSGAHSRRPCGARLSVRLAIAQRILGQGLQGSRCAPAW